jgi:hypothetical protein
MHEPIISKSRFIKKDIFGRLDGTGNLFSRLVTCLSILSIALLTGIPPGFLDFYIPYLIWTNKLYIKAKSDNINQLNNSSSSFHSYFCYSINQIKYQGTNQYASNIQYQITHLKRPPWHIILMELIADGIHAG